MNFFIDFEATQFTEEIISIGCVCENGQTFYSLVRPSDLKKVSQFITALTGITKEELKDAFYADDVFNAFNAWVSKQTENKLPITFYCYGDSDKHFIKQTIKYSMKELDSTSFALFIQKNLINYSSVVSSYFKTKQPIGLKRLITYIEGKTVHQNHNALEDAKMLQMAFYYIENNLISPDGILPIVPKVNIKTEEDVRTKAPELFLSWGPRRRQAWSADTQATKDNYTISCYCPKFNKYKYFNSIEVAAWWVIKYYVTNRKVTKKSDIDKVINRIKNAKNFCGFTWTEKSA